MKLVWVYSAAGVLFLSSVGLNVFQHGVIKNHEKLIIAQEEKEKVIKAIYEKEREVSDAKYKQILAIKENDYHSAVADIDRMFTPGSDNQGLPKVSITADVSARRDLKKCQLAYKTLYNSWLDGCSVYGCETKK